MDLWGHPRLDKSLVLNSLNLSLLFWNFMDSMKMIRNPNIEMDFDDNIGVIWLPRWLSGKESACNSGDLGSIAGSESSPGEANGSPL